MNVYFSGIGGVGIGPLAEIAKDAGYTVTGSDRVETLVTRQLRDNGVEVNIGQDGTYLRACHQAAPLDWFVYTAALPADHPELLAAKELGIRSAKRDEFLAELLSERRLKLIAVAGTHGKTTTTGMLVWAFKQLGVPVSYSVGTTLSFGPSGAYTPGSDYFVYECDEFDRNFLHFSPFLSIITAIDYDHPDTYPTRQAYSEAFCQYIQNSARTIMWQRDADYLTSTAPDTTPTMLSADATNTTPSSITSLADDAVGTFRLAGVHNRRNASLVYTALEQLGLGAPDTNLAILEAFPGTNRRFEKLANLLYSDYGHHPVEIAATLQLAKELAPHVTLVYQPHQNVRQHELQTSYGDAVFADADEIYWLTTYLSRENPDLAILTPQQLASRLSRRESIHYGELDDALWDTLQQARQAGSLVLLMGAGSIDGWARDQLAAQAPLS